LKHSLENKENTAPFDHKGDEILKKKIGEKKEHWGFQEDLKLRLTPNFDEIGDFF
jgi:hypothetical protein